MRREEDIETQREKEKETQRERKGGGGEEETKRRCQTFICPVEAGFWKALAVGQLGVFYEEVIEEGMT